MQPYKWPHEYVLAGNNIDQVATYNQLQKIKPKVEVSKNSKAQVECLYNAS